MKILPLERLRMLEKDHSELSLKEQPELLGISYSSLFYTPAPPSVAFSSVKDPSEPI